MTHSPLPNFLFIGPDKAGSTWLYALLKAHPQVFLPAVKELFFFDRYYDKGLDWYGSKFAGAGPQHRAIGEICHDYLFSAQAAERIHADLPGVTLMTILRNPVDRTYSHWQYRRRSGATRDDFEADLKHCPAIVDQSRYGRHLRVYLDLFSPGQVQCLSFEQLKTDPQGLADQVCACLNLPPLEAGAHDVSARQNAAMSARNPGAVHALRQVAKTLRAAGLERVVGAVKHSPLLKRTLFRPQTATENAPMAPDTRARLQEVFAPDNAELETLLGRKLPELWT